MEHHEVHEVPAQPLHHGPRGAAEMTKGTKRTIQHPGALGLVADPPPFALEVHLEADGLGNPTRLHAVSDHETPPLKGGADAAVGLEDVLPRQPHDVRIVDVHRRDGAAASGERANFSIA